MQPVEARHGSRAVVAGPGAGSHPCIRCASGQGTMLWAAQPSARRPSRQTGDQSSLRSRWHPTTTTSPGRGMRYTRGWAGSKQAGSHFSRRGMQPDHLATHTPRTGACGRAPVPRRSNVESNVVCCLRTLPSTAGQLPGAMHVTDAPHCHCTRVRRHAGPSWCHRAPPAPSPGSIQAQGPDAGARRAPGRAALWDSGLAPAEATGARRLQCDQHRCAAPRSGSVGNQQATGSVEVRLARTFLGEGVHNVGPTLNRMPPALRHLRLGRIQFGQRAEHASRREPAAPGPSKWGGASWAGSNTVTVWPWRARVQAASRPSRPAPAMPTRCGVAWCRSGPACMTVGPAAVCVNRDVEFAAHAFELFRLGCHAGANSRTSCVIFIEQNLGPHIEQKCATLARPWAGSVSSWKSRAVSGPDPG